MKKKQVEKKKWLVAQAKQDALKPIKNKDSKFKSFRMLLIAPSDYGKTVIGLNYIRSLVKQGDLDPERIVLVSRTVMSDPAQLDFANEMEKRYKGFKQHNRHEKIDIPFLKSVFERQKEIKERMPKTLQTWCFIFDDQISAEVIKKNDPVLNDFSCIGRHFNICQMWMFQTFRKTINTTCREQASNILVGRIGSDGAAEDILSQYDQGIGMTKRERLAKMREFYEDAVQSNDNHGFLHIHPYIQFGQGRLERNFDGFYYDMQTSSLV